MVYDLKIEAKDIKKQPQKVKFVFSTSFNNILSTQHILTFSETYSRALRQVNLEWPVTKLTQTVAYVTNMYT